jgi:replication factor A1
MAIKDLQPRQGFDVIEGEIIEKGDVREFQKFGKPGRVCTAVIQDSSGKCNFSLWNDEIEMLNVGDKVKVTDGYANEWQGEVQISAGRNGKLEVLSKGAGANEEKPAADEKPASAGEGPEEPIEEGSEEEVVEEEIIE